MNFVETNLNRKYFLPGIRPHEGLLSLYAAAISTWTAPIGDPITENSILTQVLLRCGSGWMFFALVELELVHFPEHDPGITDMPHVDLSSADKGYGRGCAWK